MLKHKIEACSIDVFVCFECEGIVNGHSTEIRQIVSNLVINALEAMPPKGKLYVRVTASRDWKDHGRPGVRLYVHDNGSGIPPAARAQIFEPFFSTKSDKGTGLGLWVIRSIIEKYRGSIHMRSTTGERGGTSFSVFLPASVGLESTQKECWKKIA